MDPRDAAKHHIMNRAISHKGELASANISRPRSRNSALDHYRENSGIRCISNLMCGRIGRKSLAYLCKL